MSSYIGDFNPGDVFNTKFTTVTSSGAPATFTGSGAVSVYKNNSVTQSTAGVTLTVDFDGLTGSNNVNIDTSADGTFYAAGSDFSIVATAGTAGGVSIVGYTLKEFSIQHRSPLRPTVATRTLDITATGAAGVDWANVEGQSTAVTLSATSTLALEPTTAGRKLDVTATGGAGIDWGNVENPTTVNNLSSTNISTSQAIASVSGAVGSVTGAVGSVTGAVGSVTGNVGGSVGSVVGAVGSVTGAVGSVTGNVGGSVGSVVGAVGSVTADVTVGTNNDKTGYALSAAGAAAVMTTQMTESYSALGVAPTPAQILFEQRAILVENSVSSTTVTTKKIDGSTTAATYTINNATTPTSITRAS